MSIRISKVIAKRGICSRRQAEELILAGRVKLNGILLARPFTLCEPDDEIIIDDQVISKTESVTKLWCFHKPRGVITSHNDPQNRPTLFSLLPKGMQKQHIISVGRLDFNSEGLILLTNDGQLARYLELPSNKLARTYKVKLFGPYSKTSQFDKLRKGIVIEGMKYAPIDIEVFELKDKSSNNFWVKITLYEGKNREIRKMMEHLRYKVQRLIRIGYGPYELKDLPLCGVVEVDPGLLKI